MSKARKSSRAYKPERGVSAAQHQFRECARILRQATRTKEDIQYLSEWIQTMNITQFHDLDINTLRLLCERMEYLYLASDVIVFNQGDPPDKLYIILKGSVRIWIRYKMADADYSDHLSFKQIDGKLMKRVATISDTDSKNSFGEMGLISQNPRNATVECSEACEFLTVSKADFEAVFKARITASITEKVNQLRSFEVFSRVNKDHLQNVSFYFSHVHFARRQYIIKQGSQPKQVYLVASGTCVVTYRTENGASLSIAEVGPGQMIGELSSVRQGPAPVSVRCLTDCVCLTTSLTNIRKSFRGEIHRLFLKYGRMKERLYEQRIVELEQTSKAMVPKMPMIPLSTRPLHPFVPTKYSKSAENSVRRRIRTAAEDAEKSAEAAARRKKLYSRKPKTAREVLQVSTPRQRQKEREKSLGVPQKSGEDEMGSRFFNKRTGRWSNIPLPNSLATTHPPEYQHPVPPLEREAQPKQWIRRVNEHKEEELRLQMADVEEGHVNWGSFSDDEDDDEDVGLWANLPLDTEVTRQSSAPPEVNDAVHVEKPVLTFLDKNKTEARVYRQDLFHWNQWLESTAQHRVAYLPTVSTRRPLHRKSRKTTYNSGSMSARGPSTSTGWQRRKPSATKANENRFQRFWQGAFY